LLLFIYFSNFGLNIAHLYPNLFVYLQYKYINFIQGLDEFSLHHASVKEAAENMIAALGDDTNPEVAYALKSIMSNIELFDNEQIQAVGSTRENLLAEFLSANKDLTRLGQNLKQATKVSANKHGQLAKETAAIVDTLINTSQSANNSDGSIVSMTIDGARILKAIEEIQNTKLQTQDDMTKLANNVKAVHVATSKLIATAR
jgi:hypothetical protein